MEYEILLTAISGNVINSEISQAWKGWVDSELDFKKSLLGEY